MAYVETIRISTEAAVDFAKAFYLALGPSRSKIKDFYCTKQTGQNAIDGPHILWNGNELADGAAMHDFFNTNMPWAAFEVQTLDCHVLNPHFYPNLKHDRNKSLLVMVSGYMRLENAKWGPMHESNETFVLIPNRDRLTLRRGRDQLKPAWLIQSQIFRYVVSHDDTTDLEPTMDLDDGADV